MTTQIGNQRSDLAEVWNTWVNQGTHEFMRLSQAGHETCITPAEAVAEYVAGMQQVQPDWFEDFAARCNAAEATGEEPDEPAHYAATDIAQDVGEALTAYLERDLERYPLEPAL